MTLTIQKIRIANPDADHGALVFAGEFLVAVLSHLSSQHGDHEGRWYLECGFGPAANNRDEFVDLDAACAWIEARMSRDKDNSLS